MAEIGLLADVRRRRYTPGDDDSTTTPDLRSMVSAYDTAPTTAPTRL
jgi:hypothetical protein